MAAYPDIPYNDRDSQSRRVPRRKVLITRSQRVRAQVRGKPGLRRFTLVHDYITRSEVDTLEAHYKAHDTAEFLFTWRDGVTYVVQYDEAELTTDHIAGQWWRVQTQLIGRPQ